jgi:hypothetical protein
MSACGEREKPTADRTEQSKNAAAGAPIHDDEIGLLRAVVEECDGLRCGAAQ